MMLRILLYERGAFYGAVLRKRLQEAADVEVELARTWVDAEARLAAEAWDVAILSLDATSADELAWVSATIALGTPPIVLTPAIDDASRDALWQHAIIDYALKDGQTEVTTLERLVRSLVRNAEVGVLVVDDSPVARHHLRRLLALHRYRILDAVDGVEALEVLDGDAAIQIVITDYHMPRLDGYGLTREIRRRYAHNKVAIIGLSAYGSGHISARFLKAGANDFIYKPFVVEELYSRVRESVASIDRYLALEDLAHRDFLTKLYNRRYFFDVGHTLFANAQRDNLHISVAMLDIDHFKRVNDTYGHDAGDKVIVAVSDALRARFRASDVVARFGGEEFCVLLVNMAPEHAWRVFDELRGQIQATVVRHDEVEIQVTVSCGLCLTVRDTLETMISVADARLYDAKTGGRNRVVTDRAEQEGADGS